MGSSKPEYWLERAKNQRKELESLDLPMHLIDAYAGSLVLAEKLRTLETVLEAAHACAGKPKNTLKEIIKGNF